MNKRYRFSLSRWGGKRGDRLKEKVVIASFPDVMTAIDRVTEANPGWQISMFWPCWPH